MRPFVFFFSSLVLHKSFGELPAAVVHACCLPVALSMLLSQIACAQEVFVQYKPSLAGLGKCGFPAYAETDCRTHLYHQQIAVEHKWRHYDGSGSTDTEDHFHCDDGSLVGTISPGSWVDITDEERNATLTELKPDTSCDYTNTYTGTWTKTYAYSDTRHYDGQDCEGNDHCQTYHFDDYSHTAIAQFIPGSGWGWLGTVTTSGGIADPCNPDNGTNGPITTEFQDAAILQPPPKSFPAVTVTQDHELDAAPPDYDDLGSCATYEYTLLSEFTDEELRSDILTIMPPYSTNWYTPNPQNYDFVATVALSSIDDAHVGPSGPMWPWWRAPMLQQMQYRFAVPNSEAGTDYYIRWHVYTWDTTTGQLDRTGGKCVVIGTGDPTQPAYSTEFTADAPYWERGCNPGGGVVITWVDDVSISSSGGGSGGGDGGGDGGGGCAGSGAAGPLAPSGCAGCGGGTGGSGMPGSGDIGVGQGVTASFSLGQSTLGYAAGSLDIFAEQPSPALATPASLSVPLPLRTCKWSPSATNSAKLARLRRWRTS
jgi:hypothetical protein